VSETTIQFADGVADVVVLGPIARIDFFVLRPVAGRPRDADTQPDLQRVPAFTIAMPLEALANSVSILEDVRKRLLDSGVLGQAGAPPDPTMRHRPSSPNFKPDA
jgi:hypothetical protein